MDGPGGPHVTGSVEPWSCNLLGKAPTAGIGARIKCSTPDPGPRKHAMSARARENRSMRRQHIGALALVGWIVLRQVFGKSESAPDSVAADTPNALPDPEPSRRLMLDVCMQERSHQTTSVAGLNAFAAALLGFEAVLGVVGLKIDACPNWKGAALSALAVGILCILLSLADFVFPSHTLRRDPPSLVRKIIPRRLWSISPRALAGRFEHPLARSEKVVFATAARIFIHGTDYVIKPKKRCLTMSVLFLVSALILGGVGVGVKAVRG